MLEVPRADDRTEDAEPCAFPLRDLQKGKPDKLGNIVREILWIERNYAIYSSDKGIYVHFSDKAEMEKEQRKRFTEISPELCELRYLTAQMRGWNWWPWFSSHRRHTLYEHNMAQALMLIIEDKDDPAAKRIAKETLEMAVRRVTTENTIRYVRACLISAIGVIALGTMAFWALNHIGHPEALKWTPYLVGGMFGAVGAVFSIVTRVEAFRLQPCDESRMNYWMSAIRVLMGVMSAIALLLLVDTLLVDVLSKLTGSPKHIIEWIDDPKNVVFWQAMAVLGFVAGFAERLIPNLLRQTAGKMEAAVGTPVQAVRSHPNRGEDKPA
jgi:hypothetical protein